MQKFVTVQLLLLALIAPSSFAGGNYKLKTDRFENKKTASYDLRENDECKLTATSKSKIAGCSLIAVSTETNTPSLLLFTTSSGWDILPYRSVPPYSDGKVPAIVTYTSGTKSNKQLPAIYSGNVVSGSTVLETVIIRFGGDDLSKIDNVEIKFGSNEYYIKLDPVLTKKALNYEE